MNILIVHNEYKFAGGEDTVVANETRLLQEHGNKVVLYKRSNKELDAFSKLQKLTLPITTIYNSKTVKDIKNIIKSEAIDIVHVHNTLNLVSPSVYYAAMKCKVPVVQTVHNFRLECMGAEFYRDGKICEDCLTKGNMCALKHACYRGSRVQTFACLLSNWVHRTTGVYKKINYICLTDFNREKLLQWKHHGKAVLDKKQLYLKPNFTFESTYVSKDDSKEEFYLYVGRIKSIKGIEIIIKAFEKMPDKMLKLAGTGEEIEKWQQYINVNNVKNIEFLGYLKREAIVENMSKAKAVIVASQWYETFGMIVAESYSCATPVIAGDIGNIGNIVDDGITGVKFEYDNSDALVEAVKRFETLNRSELSKNALEMFKMKYSSENNYQKLMEIYLNVLNIKK